MKETVPIGLALLAMTPLVSAMRSVALEEWLAYGIYVVVGIGLVGAAWSWHRRFALGVKLGLSLSAFGLLVRFVLTLGGSAPNAYLLTFAVWALGATLGAIWAWRKVEAGAAVIVGVSGAVFLTYLVLNARDGLATPTMTVGLVLGVLGALVAARGLTAREPPAA